MNGVKAVSNVGYIKLIIGASMGESLLELQQMIIDPHYNSLNMTDGTIQIWSSYLRERNSNRNYTSNKHFYPEHNRM